LADDRLDVHEQVVANLYTAQLHAAIGSLSPAKREALLLAYVHDRTLPEIAATLGIPLGTVKSRLARGRDDLKKLLLADGIRRLAE
jgi:RNA polymerase sigma-70 factor (ECF subfamily)